MEVIRVRVRVRVRAVTYMEVIRVRVRVRVRAVTLSQRLSTNVTEPLLRCLLLLLLSSEPNPSSCRFSVYIRLGFRAAILV